ncbi:MAG: DUF4282 domain-containing protein, partial [Gammaproteobacteria bacterium]
VVGAVIMVFLQNYLRPILVSLQESGVPEILQTLLTDPFKVLSHGAEVANEAVVHAHSKGLVVDFFDGSRYLMYIGFIYILCVYFFSEGVVGKLRVWAALGKADIRNMAAKIFDFDNLNMKNFFKAIYYTLYVLITLSAICQAINGIANLASDNGFLLIITAIVTKILGTIILRALFELVFGVIDTHKFAKEARDTLAEQK